MANIHKVGQRKQDDQTKVYKPGCDLRPIDPKTQTLSKEPNTGTWVGDESHGVIHKPRPSHDDKIVRSRVSRQDSGVYDFPIEEEDELDLEQNVHNVDQHQTIHVDEDFGFQQSQTCVRPKQKLNPHSDALMSLINKSSQEQQVPQYQDTVYDVKGTKLSAMTSSILTFVDPGFYSTATKPAFTECSVWPEDETGKTKSNTSGAGKTPQNVSIWIQYAVMMAFLVALVISHVSLQRRLDILEHSVYLCRQEQMTKTDTNWPSDIPGSVGQSDRHAQRQTDSPASNHHIASTFDPAYYSQQSSHEVNRKFGNDLHFSFTDLGTPIHHENINEDLDLLATQRVKDATKLVEGGMMSKNLSRSRRQAAKRGKKRKRSRSKSMSLRIKRYTSNLIRELEMPTDKFVGNFWEVLDFDDHFAENSIVSSRVMDKMPCQPTAKSTSRVEFQKEGCALAFFTNDSISQHLEFDNGTGTFTVQTEGLYHIEASVVIVDKTPKLDDMVGVYLNHDPRLACPNSGFVCPAYNVNGNPRERYRVCTMNGMFQMKVKDTLSLRTMKRDVVFRMEKVRNAYFNAILMKPMLPPKKLSDKKKNKRKKRRQSR